jgi:hypothetical protein
MTWDGFEFTVMSGTTTDTGWITLAGVTTAMKGEAWQDGQSFVDTTLPQQFVAKVICNTNQYRILYSVDPCPSVMMRVKIWLP